MPLNCIDFDRFMKSVFFDIECAGVHKTYAKICAFGYVVCDENFNILEKEDILINPRGRFELTDRKGEKGIVLPYEYDEFKKHPPFTAVYERIKSLLEDKENLVFGHAVLNDIKYLNLETKRFHLPSFKFRFLDSQLIFMTHKNDYSRQFGLEHIANDLGVEFTPHRAVDDAYATMRIVEAICRVRDCNAFTLAESMNITLGKIENFNVTGPQSKGFKNYNAEKLIAKNKRSRAREKFYNNLSRKRAKSEGKLKGMSFTFSRALEDEISVSIPFVDKIYSLGGKYSQKLDRCNVYVASESTESARTKNARAEERIKVISLDEFKELLDD